MTKKEKERIEQYRKELRRGNGKWRPIKPRDGDQLLRGATSDPLVVRVEELFAVTGVVPELSRRNRIRYVALAKAEKILMRVGDIGALSDGRIRVIPNPVWNVERWRAYMAMRGCDPDGPGWE
ncbi:MAG TPA: hypothetical protein VH593_27015 [Ktedonobacteraceae bacterium]|jgi:hypothetical protein